MVKGASKGSKQLAKNPQFKQGMQAIGGLIVGQIATQAISGMASSGFINSKQSRFAGSMIGMASAGAAIGSIFLPGLGTAIGAATGAVAGFTLELLNSRDKMMQALGQLSSGTAALKDLFEVGQSFGIAGADYYNIAKAFEHSGMNPRQLEQMIQQYIGTVGGVEGQNDVYTFLSEMQTLFKQFSAPGGGGRAGFQELLQNDYQLSARATGRLYQALSVGALSDTSKWLSGSRENINKNYAYSQAQEQVQWQAEAMQVGLIGKLDLNATEAAMLRDEVKKLRDVESEIKTLLEKSPITKPQATQATPPTMRTSGGRPVPVMNTNDGKTPSDRNAEMKASAQKGV
jgi:hypothetical protein